MSWYTLPNGDLRVLNGRRWRTMTRKEIARLARKMARLSKRVNP